MQKKMIIEDICNKEMKDNNSARIFSIRKVTQSWLHAWNRWFFCFYRNSV